MLGKRILTAAVGMPLLIAAIFAGRPVFLIVLSVAVGVGILEFSRLARKAGAPPIVPAAIVFGIAVPWLRPANGGLIMMTWLLGLIAVAVGARLFFGNKVGWARVGSTFFGVFYIGVLFNFLAFIFNLRSGPRLVVLTFAATWIADTAAYGIGGWLGRTPLAPTISPNKTVEGAAGSLAITALVLAPLNLTPLLGPGQRAGFGLVIAVFAMIGDLFESWLKRRAGVKDSGVVFPGHGGFLDRVDSLLFSAPAGYMLLRVWVGG